LCFSILVLTRGELEPLAGVYTISFLSVMAYFAIGNLLLKIKRAKLPRPEHATAFTVFLALLGVVVALYGNIKLHPEYLVVFLQYFVPAILIIYALLNRLAIFELGLMVLKSASENIRRIALVSQLKLTRLVRKTSQQQFVFFTKGDDIATLNRVMMYVLENELTSRLRIVTVLKEGQEVSTEFMKDMEVLDRAYPDIKIVFLTERGTFGPELIDRLSREWNIPKNFMFIGSPGDRFPYRVSELGGVRLIIN
ncbi:MAG TPA: APC family permease, partial [Cyclobacteriaceae bacterium]|nr:APC family permease [Cyclobacteriaceae bacterium]